MKNEPKKTMDPETLRTSIIAFVIKEKGNWEKIYANVFNKNYLTNEQLNETCSKIEEIEKDGWKIITIIDKDYPKCFQKSENLYPPYALFVKGDLSDGKIKFIKNISSAPEKTDEDTVLITENIEGEMDDFRLYYMEEMMAREGFRLKG